jgi:hypothetical protein
MGHKRIENEMSFADIPVSKARALKVSSPKGSILIALIGTMLVFSAIGAAMLPMFSTSSYVKVYADQGRKAFLLAESGFRYAASEYLNAEDHQKGATLEELNDQTNQPYTLLNNNGSFSLIVYPCYYETTTVSGTTLNTKVHGTFSSSVTGIDLSSGGWLKIGSNSSYHQYSSGSGSGSTVTFINLTGDLSGVSPGDPVYPVGCSISTIQTVTEGGNLALQSGTGSNAFPAVNGIFTIDDSNYPNIYTYTTRNGDTLNGITLSSSSETWSDLTISANTNIVAKEFIKLFSTGTFGNTSRTNTYNVPIGVTHTWQEERVDLDDLVADNPLAPGQSLGDFVVDDVGGDKALRVTATTGLPAEEAIIALNGGGSPNYFYLSWDNAGGFLGYDAQVKIGIGTWDSEGFIEKPQYYMAGLSMRIRGLTHGTLTSYGLSFMRTNTGLGVNSDGIPDSLVPDPSLVDSPLILLWDRSGPAVGDDEWLAYMKLAVPAHCDGAEGDTEATCLDNSGTWIPAVDNSHVLDNDQCLKDWSTIIVRMVEAASIKYSGSSDIAPGDTVTGETSGAEGYVIKKINDGSDEVLLLNNVDGTFSGMETVNNGTVSVAVLEWRAKDNYIWAFYGDTDSHGTNDVAIDNIRGENQRSGNLHWLPAQIDDWSSSYDHFTLVQWNSYINTSHDSSLRRMGTGKEENAIIRTNSYITPSETYDYEPELGLNALGNDADETYFDDFAYYIQTGGSSSGFLSSGFINAVVLD